MRSIIFAGALAAALASCGSSKDTGTDTDTVASTRSQVLAKVNQLRADSSLPAFTAWTDEQSCADAEAADDEAAGQAHSTFGSCHEFGQTECPGWPALNQIAADCVVQMWQEGPGNVDTHGDYMILSSTTYHKLAVGLHVDSAGTVWAVLDFSP